MRGLLNCSLLDCGCESSQSRPQNHKMALLNSRTSWALSNVLASFVSDGDDMDECGTLSDGGQTYSAWLCMAKRG